MSIQLESAKKAHALLRHYTKVGGNSLNEHKRNLRDIISTEIRVFVGRCYTKGGEEGEEE